jgi:hypothetical protein
MTREQLLNRDDEICRLINAGVGEEEEERLLEEKATIECVLSYSKE